MIEKIQIVVNDFKESFENMPLETVGRLTLALFKYANDEDPSDVLAEDSIARVIFPTIKTHIERHEDYRRTKAENGKKGGGQVGNANAKRQQPTTTKNDQERPKTTKNDLKRTPNPNPNPYPNPLKDKRPYGECANVFLTDEEHQKIINEGYAGLIEELSLYIASKGDKYKSHYAVIKQWANRRKKEQVEKTVSKPNQFTQGVMRTEIDFSDLEKRLVKN